MRHGIGLFVVLLTLATSFDASAGPSVSLEQQAELQAPAASSVATDGSTLIVGSSAANASTGVAYVFTRAGSSWTLQQTVTASDGASFDLFGSSVSLSGGTVAIGASGKGSGAGAVYLFVNTSGTWAQQAEVTASDGAAGDGLGYAVALSGGTLLAGAYAAGQTGAAYVFTSNGSVWSQQAKLTAADGAANDFFGLSVALSGSTALIGAYGSANQAGAAYVFTTSAGTWSQRQKLLASDSTPQSQFGFSVSVSGNAAVIGANGPGAHGGGGSAYVFTSHGGMWSQRQRLVAADGTAGDGFGGAVALSDTTALVAAPDFGQGGAAYVFWDSQSGWSQGQEILPSDAPNGFGSALALTGAAAAIASNDAAYVYGTVANPVPAFGSGDSLALGGLLLGSAIVVRTRRRPRS